MALDYNIIGERLKKARVEKNMTQEKLAEQLDVSIAFLYVLTSKSLINSPTGLLILSIHLFILVPYVLLYFAS